MTTPDTSERCRICGRSIYFIGFKDHVGRRTSDGRWVHHGVDTSGDGYDHEAVPR